MSNFERKFVLKNTFSDVSKFEEKKYYYSDQETHFRIPWKFSVERLNGFLAAYLYCDFENGTDGWEIEVEWERILISPNGKHSLRKSNAPFNKTTKGRGWPKLLEWEEMLKKYAVADKITMEVHVKIIKTNGILKKRLRNFDEKVKYLTDATLTVKDRKFNILRGTLAGQSSHFNTLFFGTPAASRKKSFELEDVDADDFQDFLEALHGEAAIIDDNVERMLKLAQQYDAPIVTKKCQEYLIDKAPELSLEQKLRLSEDFNLPELKAACLPNMASIKDIRKFLPAKILDLDRYTMAAVIEKMLALPELK